MIRFQEIFPPRPSIEQLGFEARRQVYSAVTGKILMKGLIPEISLFDETGCEHVPYVFGFPDLASAGTVGKSLRQLGPTLDIYDVDGVIIPNSPEEFDKSGLGRIFGSKIIRSVFMKGGLKGITEIPHRDHQSSIQVDNSQPALAISRSYGFWPRQGALRNSFDGESISFIDSFDRHHPPGIKEKKPKIWQAFESTLMELVRPLDLGENILNINHHGDILPPISFLAGNEGILINWLTKFFSSLGINTNPNITYINPVFPKEGMILDRSTFQFLPLIGAEV